MSRKKIEQQLNQSNQAEEQAGKAENAEKEGFFGDFGGKYVAEVLRPALDELQKAFENAVCDDDFAAEIDREAAAYIGRSTPLLYARRSTEALGGAQIYIKLEGLANTGAHKINNAMGQALLAKRMGKRRIIAETGAGQHGVAAAAVCARLGLDCTVYMGEVDMKRQQPNVFWMRQYGAQVVPVSTGSRTLKDAVNEALRDWAASFPDTHYLLGSALGPAPFPEMVRTFQSVIGREVEEQLDQYGLKITPELGKDAVETGKETDSDSQGSSIRVEALIACVGGGSNAIGFFSPFIQRSVPRLIGAEAGGRGPGIGDHAARMNGSGSIGVAQGYKSFFLMDDEGQVQPTHSISAGLDYPGIGPQLAHLGSTGRIEFTSVTDEKAVEALKFFARHEGLSFALESAHAGALAMELAPTLPPDKALIINMSGLGDKDIFITAKAVDPEGWRVFLKKEIES